MVYNPIYLETPEQAAAALQQDAAKNRDLSVHDIVKAWLLQHGYDGLFNADGPCGCEIDDFSPCDCNFMNCYPAYKHNCKPEECSEDCPCSGECAGYISPEVSYYLTRKKPDSSVGFRSCANVGQSPSADNSAAESRIPPIDYRTQTPEHQLTYGG